jgi:carboxyvinyl-carboxyphosphonate phosphorylmutase
VIAFSFFGVDTFVQAFPFLCIGGTRMTRLSHQDLRRNFRQLLASDTCYHTASVFDPMSARIAADLGFEVGILGGSVASLQVLGAPDFALITLSEFAEQATRIGRVAQLPVIADADHGYGNALNVMRTIVELERAGVAALTIEDTLLPAQFGRKSTDLITVAEGVGKIRAALEARVDTEMAIIARTNAGILPNQEIISRTRQYQAAGADGICMVGIQDFDQLEQIAEHLTVPLMLVTYGNPALRDDKRLAELGVRVTIDGHGAYFAAIKATYDSLREQRQIFTQASDLSATELTHTYTQPEEYILWAKEYMSVKE